MGLDPKLFRAEQGGNPELVKESQRRRGKSTDTVDAVIACDIEWRKSQQVMDAKRSLYNQLNKQVGLKKKAGENADELIAQVKEADAEVQTATKAMREAELELKRLINPIGNIVHESVPISNNEDDNRVERKWGTPREATTDLLHHHELLMMIDGYSPEAGRNVAGHRGYFLKGPGVMLNMALIQYGLAFLAKRKYTPLQTPFFMKKEVMAETAQLEQFNEELYKVGSGEEAAGDDEEARDAREEKFLIATSEQPISAYHRGEWLHPNDLPLRYAGFSTCFRKEAGAHGRDCWGIFRVHQFEKIEQFVLTTPEKSWEMQDEMINTAEEFYQSLGLPYHVIAIVSGALNNAAAKKLDLEAWFPTLACYRELVSCSNCTDYQSRNLEVRCGTKKEGEREKKYVHMLNATLTATERTICCILENYQTDKGIKVPDVLQPYLRDYLDGGDLIPFVNPPPKNRVPTAATSVKGKSA